MNMNFEEVLYYYMALMVIAIIAGITHIYWLDIPAMATAFMAITGWSPIKAWMLKRKAKATRTAAQKTLPPSGRHQSAA